MNNLQIILWDKKFQSDFVRLNKQWIERYFRLEASDFKTLGNPQGIIIDNGGQIFLARTDDGHIVGCCALIYHPDNGTFELAKMAVNPIAQGQGIGYLLGSALLSYAKSIGAKRVFLEANTRLAASVALYHKLGFKPVETYHAAYERCDLFMEIEL